MFGISCCKQSERNGLATEKFLRNLRHPRTCQLPLLIYLFSVACKLESSIITWLYSHKSRASFFVDSQLRPFCLGTCRIQTAITISWPLPFTALPSGFAAVLILSVTSPMFETTDDCKGCCRTRAWGRETLEGLHLGCCGLLIENLQRSLAVWFCMRLLEVSQQGSSLPKAWNTQCISARQSKPFRELGLYSNHPWLLLPQQRLAPLRGVGD